ncbi:hypothetical protein HMPREF0322_01330 [Desulfitobacterium hafniense DP7]|uniref:Uncharacterized protein n=1 Tax=Desulfitobacterium hafniense DP7 TaxID=537010 RepID=G9XK47_DESHA|nr:hypothetical protein HMPREF0322_01330 [Desulfitobacterium hafniense DP7]
MVFAKKRKNPACHSRAKGLFIQEFCTNLPDFAANHLIHKTEPV